MSGSSRIIEGVFAVNKPKGDSSAQVLRNLQAKFNPSSLFAPWLEEERRLRQREPSWEKKKRSRAKREVQVKLGHGGTLDPMATGVLIVGVGKGTKDLDRFLGCTKSYEAVVLFGAATNSYDVMGEIVARKPSGHITEAAVRSALEQFRGQTKQTPPIFSALRMDGMRLYEYARQGKPLPREIEQRDVTVLELELMEWLPPGSHDYALPESEASVEEKKLATELMGVSRPASPAVGAKRKLFEEEGDHEGAAAKRQELEHPRRDESTNDSQQSSPADDSKASLANQSIDSVDQSEQAGLASATDSALPACRLRMTVSSGFYVRSLCHDLGKALSSLGTMAALIRSRQAGFELGVNVVDYDEFNASEESWAPQVASHLDDWNNGKVEKPERRTT